MAKFKKKTSTISRENTSEIKSDSLASNRLAVKSKNYENAKVNKKKPKNSTKKERVDILAPKKVSIPAICIVIPVDIEEDLNYIKAVNM